MKKILILSYNFAPRHTVGAIRPTKLAQALAREGHTVDVVTVKPFGELDHSFDSVLEELNHIYYIDRPIVIEKSAPQNTSADVKKLPCPNRSKSKNGVLRKLKLEAREIKKIINSERFASDFKKLIHANKEIFSQYDIAFSTYGPIASHLCGLVMKKEFPDIRWIADFRDPMVVNTTTSMTKPYRAGIQKRVCRRADRLVAVSNGYFKRIFGEKYSDKASVIYNGFDRADIDMESVPSDGLFSFVYVGSLYDGKRDLSVLFEVMRELVDEGKIDKADIHIKYAGNHLATLTGQASKYALEDCIDNCGVLCRSDCLKLQASARHLVLSTWNEKGEGGVFPGKFLEYIMMGKPVVSLVSGDEPASEVTVVMKRARLGITYEQATHDSDKKALKDYILADYQRFKDGMEPIFDSNPNEVEKFDFSNAARQIEELF